MFCYIFIILLDFDQFVDIRQDAALANTRANVWLEPALSYASDGCLFIAILCIETVEMGMLPWPLMDNKAVCHIVLGELSFPPSYYTSYLI